MNEKMNGSKEYEEREMKENKKGENKKMKIKISKDIIVLIGGMVVSVVGSAIQDQRIQSLVNKAVKDHFKK